MFIVDIRDIPGVQLMNYNTLSVENNGVVAKLEFKKNVNNYRYNAGKKNEEYITFADKIIKAFDFLRGDSEYLYIIPYETYDHCILKNKINKMIKTNEKKENNNYALYTKDDSFIKDIFYASLEFRAFAIFFIPSINVYLIPTDHLDVFVYGYKAKLSEIKKKITTNEFINDNFVMK